MKFKDRKTARPQDRKTAKWSCGHVVMWSRSHAFTLVEMLVTLALLSLIVLALMAVFNTTQNAFRSGLTETDILESGRLAMGLISDDLAETTPSYDTNGAVGMYGLQSGYVLNGRAPVNFYVGPNAYSAGYQPFIQYLPGSSLHRSNVLENFFLLSRQNVSGRPSWVATGYAVDPLSWPTNALYRFVMITNVMKGNPFMLFSNFYAAVSGEPSASRKGNPFTNTITWTHLMDGVMDLRVRAYDPNGLRITNYADVYNGRTNFVRNTFVTNSFYVDFPFPANLQSYFCLMYSNAVPASVEVTLGVMENDTLQRAEALGLTNIINPHPLAQISYVSNHVAQVHLFRQRVWIRNVDLAAYQ